MWNMDSLGVGGAGFERGSAVQDQDGEGVISPFGWRGFGLDGGVFGGGVGFVMVASGRVRVEGRSTANTVFDWRRWI